MALLSYNQKLSPDPTPTEAVTRIANTINRPGPLTTEWWSVLIAGALSTVLAVIGLPGSAATQVAAIIAPIALALVYAYVRSRTKGALADALTAIFPQALSQASASHNGAPDLNGPSADS